MCFAQLCVLKFTLCVWDMDISCINLCGLENRGTPLWRVHLRMSQVNAHCILLWLSPFLLRHCFSLKPKLTDLALLSGEQHPCTEKGNWTQHLNPNQEVVFNWYLLGKGKKWFSSGECHWLNQLHSRADSMLRGS